MSFCTGERGVVPGIDIQVWRPSPEAHTAGSLVSPARAKGMSAAQKLPSTDNPAP